MTPAARHAAIARSFGVDPAGELARIMALPVRRQHAFVHLYFDPSVKYRSMTPGLRSCMLCGKVQPRDRQLSPCRGQVQITLRDVEA